MYLFLQHTLPVTTMTSTFLYMESYFFHIIFLMVSTGSFLEESIYIKSLKEFTGVFRLLSAPFSVDPLCYINDQYSALMYYDSLCVCLSYETVLTQGRDFGSFISAVSTCHSAWHLVGLSKCYIN